MAHLCSGINPILLAVTTCWNTSTNRNLIYPRLAVSCSRIIQTQPLMAIMDPSAACRDALRDGQTRASPLSTFSRRDSRGIREGEFVGQLPSMPTRRATDADSADSGTWAKRTRVGWIRSPSGIGRACRASGVFGHARHPRGGRGRVNSRTPPPPGGRRDCKAMGARVNSLPI